MRRVVSLMILLGSLSFLQAGIGIYQRGTVVRMHMGECTLSHRGFMTAAFGPPSMPDASSCPEYTLVSPNVVYIIVGKSSNQLIPLAETIDFRIVKNELAVRVDDAKRESKFMIKEMVVRSEWDRMQRHIEEQMKLSEARETVEK
jgi:hypothetical protein